MARKIRAFVEDPVTNLLKSVGLCLIAISEISHTFREDVTHWRFRVGHGLLLIGLFGILNALPPFLEALDAGSLFLESEFRDVAEAVESEEEKIA